MPCKPLALSNWKMAMTVAEGLAWVHDFEVLAGDLLDAVDVVVCPPYTALWPMAQALRDSRIQLGGQNIAPSADLARTGEVSAALLADGGCRWVMLGHWEVRRHLGDDDGAANRKVHLALDAGLAPILLIGEARGDGSPLAEALARQLTHLLDGCQSEQVATMAFVYEPEGAIGVSAPASQRTWLPGARSFGAGCGSAGATQWPKAGTSSTAVASRQSTPPACWPVQTPRAWARRGAGETPQLLPRSCASLPGRALLDRHS